MNHSSWSILDFHI